MASVTTDGHLGGRRPRLRPHRRRDGEHGTYGSTAQGQSYTSNDDELVATPRDIVHTRDVCGKCGARRVDQQIGLEETPEQWVDSLVAVFREVRRVLRPEGTLWLEVGDSYAGSWSGTGTTPKRRARSNAMRGITEPDQGSATARTYRNVPPGSISKPKDLIGAPWQLAFALRADGWYLRSDIIWARPNPMPETVTDRPTKSHSYVFLLSKQPRYYWDAEAVREPQRLDSSGNGSARPPKAAHRGGYPRSAAPDRHRRRRFTQPGTGRNVRIRLDHPHPAVPGSPLRHLPRSTRPPLHPRGHVGARLLPRMRNTLATRNRTTNPMPAESAIRRTAPNRPTAADEPGATKR